MELALRLFGSDVVNTVRTSLRSIAAEKGLEFRCPPEPAAGLWRQ